MCRSKKSVKECLITETVRGLGMILFELGEKIKNLRKEKGISQEELAKKSGISRATLSKLENGNLTKISVATFDKILGVLGYTIDIKPKNPFLNRNQNILDM